MHLGKNKKANVTTKRDIATGYHMHKSLLAKRHFSLWDGKAIGKFYAEEE